MLGAVIRDIVSIDRGDNRVFKAKLLHGDSNPLRFEWIQWLEGVRIALLHGAEVTLSCAQFSHDHEGGGVVRPALPDVRALGFLTHGVKIEGFNDLAGLKIFR
jgi:hypothetical protein